MSETPVSVHQLRRQILEYAGRGDAWALIGPADVYLACVPDDDQVRATAVNALIGKGLYSVAAEVAAACPAQSPNHAELASAARQLGRAATDRLDWAAMDATFQRNLAVLRDAGPEGRDLAGQAERGRAEAAGCAVHRTSDGNLLVRGPRPDGLRVWLTPPLDYRGTLEAVPDPPPWRGRLPKPFLFEGVGTGWLLPRIWAATRGTYLSYSPMVFVVEPDPRALAVVLHLHDWTAPLADERVRVFAGSGAWERWRDWMLARPEVSVPHTVGRLPLWEGVAPGAAEAMLEQVARARQTLYAETRRRVEQIYRGRDVAWWARRFREAGPSDPLRVLCVTSRFTTFLQHSMRDLAAAMESLGVRTRLLIEIDDHSPIQDIMPLQAMLDFRPDLLLVIDHHRHEYASWFVDQVPYLCWIQDDMPALFEPGVGSRLGPLDFTMGFGRTTAVLKSGYPLQRFLPCRMAVDPAKFAAGPRPDAAPACDVAYVSHHSEPPEALFERLCKVPRDERVRRMLQGLFDRLMSLASEDRFDAGYPVEPVLEEAWKEWDLPPEPRLRQEVLSLVVRPLADRVLRHVTLRWVADWADAAGRRFHLYGRGWENHPRFGRYAMGVAEHGAHLAAIARAAAISLHTGAISALHQRVLETVCAGGFVLVRYNPRDYLSPGTEAMRRFLRERGITAPVRLRLDEAPPEYVAERQERLRRLGQPPRTEIHVTEEFLLENDSRLGVDPRYERAGLAFPDLPAISFDGPAAFAERAEFFLAHPDQRQAIAERMRQTAVELFSYQALAGRFLGFLGEALASASGAQA